MRIVGTDFNKMTVNLVDGVGGPFVPATMSYDPIRKGIVVTVTHTSILDPAWDLHHYYYSPDLTLAYDKFSTGLIAGDEELMMEAPVVVLYKELTLLIAETVKELKHG